MFEQRVDLMNIDMHHHFLPEELVSFIETHPQETQARIERTEDRTFICFQQGWKVPVDRGQYDFAARVRDMANMRLDAAVLSVAPICFFYWLDPVVTLETSRICNDWVAAQAKTHACMYPMATIPMQNIPMALSELRRAHEELGMQALEIAPIIQGVQLDDERFDPIYQYCNEHGILVYLHPQVMETRPEYEKYYNTNLIGNVLETCIGLNHMLFGGVFQRFPDLHVLASHGGGYFPYQFGRLMHGYAVRPEPKVRISKPPQQYLRNIYFDTITHWEPALQFLVDTFGASHVVIGTDYPFDMGDLSPMDRVEGIRLSEKALTAICSGNAMSLLRGEAPPEV